MDDKNFPTIQLNSIQLPELAGMEINDECELCITVKVKGLRKAEQYDLPTMNANEGGMPHNSYLVGDFQIVDVQKEEKSFDDEYKDKYNKVMSSIREIGG
jgi:hypothetical protein